MKLEQKTQNFSQRLIYPVKRATTMEGMKRLVSNAIITVPPKLDQRLEEQIPKKSIGPEQWYRSHKEWMEIEEMGPFNRLLSPEVSLHFAAIEKGFLAPVKDHMHVYYGIGSALKELNFVSWQLDKSHYSETIAIDVNRAFLKIFYCNLLNRFGNPWQNNIVHFQGYEALFQDTNKQLFTFSNSLYSSQLHVCLGNAIGNFTDQSEIFTVFKNNTRPGDFLLLGVHLSKNPEETLKSYEESGLYSDFALQWLGKEIDYRKIRWVLEKPQNKISAEVVIKMFYNGIEAFRSKRFDLVDLMYDLEAFGFKTRDVFNDMKEAAFVLLQRT